LFGLHIPPSLFQREGGKGGESERKNKRGECLFKPLKSKIKALKINGFFILLTIIFGQ
jgi:hypothetical protein